MLIDEKVIMLENQDKYLKRAFELSLEYPITPTRYAIHSSSRETQDKTVNIG